MPRDVSMMAYVSQRVYTGGRELLFPLLIDPLIHFYNCKKNALTEKCLPCNDLSIMFTLFLLQGKKTKKPPKGTKCVCCRKSRRAV